MKKILKSAMIIAASALLFVSCNEEDATPVASPSEFGTVRGFLFYDVDDTGDDDDDNDDIPAGAIVQITTMSQPDGDGGFDFTAGEPTVITTRVAANGSYTFTIPTNSGGADFTVQFFDFEGDKLFERFIDGESDEISESGVYSTGTRRTGTVFPGQTDFLARSFLSDFASNASPTLF